MKAIIYCRKSTDDKDKQQQSLWTQLEWCENYATNNNVEIIDTIVVSESAKDIWREWFKKLMNQIEKWHANVIICMYFDRLSRNPRDSAWIQELLQKWKILKIITSTRIFTVEDSWLLFSVESWFANEYILKIKKWVKDWFKQKMKAWWYYSQAPLWYLNDKINKNIIIDPDRSIYISRMFELRSEWCSCEMIRDILYTEWLRSKTTWRKVAKWTIEACLQNPFYYWWIKYNWDMFDKWELYKWNHIPLITKELYDKVQKITRWVKYIHDRDLTPLKWKVYHYESKELISPALIKKKYVYFQTRVWENQVWFNQNEILKYFDKAIHLYRIPDQYQKDIRKLLQEEYDKQYWNIFQKIWVLRKQVTEKELEKQSLILMRWRWEITWDELVSIKNKLSEEIESSEEKIKELSKKNEFILSDFNRLVELLFFGIDNWKSLDEYKKLSFINEIVVELYFDNEKRLYIKENPIYKALKSDNFDLWSEGPGLNWHTQGLKP